ncbi:type IV secretory system conjugative DNA transfer family protein [Streptomyces sp. GMY02]|uniref:type IV secretory system conjugative DNA transfer family protein n=1 Tax=Streptomyces sp. GMY02 TaxID=1333528 RepID=UPI001C2B7DA7|nr:type IV secretory system conjugative DNA transfer family protein [Streptomyces sp. GMY02]QXE36080.1 type IV secretory system conjugative DNA transfer family protein [Streptomyces sp. GMY02]
MPHHHDGQGRGPVYDGGDRGQTRGGVPDGLLVGLLGFVLGLSLLVWTATGLAGLFTHGAWPEAVTYARTPLAMRQLLAAPHDVAGAWPDTPPDQLSGYGLFWGLLISQLMVLTVLAVFVLGVAARYRVVRARRRELHHAHRERAAGTRDMLSKGPMNEAARSGERESGGEDTGPGVAAMAGPTPGLQPSVTTAAAQATAPAPPEPVSVPPVATAPTPPPAVAFAAVPAPRTEPSVRYGDPLTRRPTAVQAILDAEGPALVVTSDPTVWAETKDARAKLGPVLLYDPGHLCDTPARMHWSPTAGCEDPATAAARAAALLTPVRPHALLDAAMADTAETLLRCWLHAAAVDGRPFKQVHRWAQGGSAHEAVRILRTHPKAASGLAGLLESALTAHPERREVAQQLTARTLAALSSVHIRDACTPNRTDALALDSFVNEGGTLYVVGEPIEDPRSRPGAMPLLTALTSSVVEHGRRMAARSSDGRLDPPMTLVLDDVAAVAPLPQLPELLAAGQDQGLPALVLLRSRQQGKDRWPHADLQALSDGT